MQGEPGVSGAINPETEHYHPRIIVTPDRGNTP